MSATDIAAIEVGAETASPVTAVHAWGQTVNQRDLDRMLALSASDIELARDNRAERGHEAVSRPLQLQSHRVAQHVHARRYLVCATTVIAEAPIEPSAQRPARGRQRHRRRLPRARRANRPHRDP